MDTDNSAVMARGKRGRGWMEVRGKMGTFVIVSIKVKKNTDTQDSPHTS